MRKKVIWLIEKLVHFRVLGITIVGSSILLAIVVVALGPDAEPQARTEKAWPVSTMVAAPAELQPMLVAYGKVESRQIASLTTSVTAPVENVYASEGSWVNKGQLLVQLDDQELKLALVVANAEFKKKLAQLEKAKSDFTLSQNITAHHRDLKSIADAKLERYLDLYKTKMVSDAILDEVRREASERAITLERHLAELRTFPNVIDQHEAALAEGEARVRRAEMDLAQTAIESPFSGRVIETLVAAGDRVYPGHKILRVADYTQLEVRASIQSDIGSVLRQKIADGVSVLAFGHLDDQVIEFSLARLSGDVKVGQSGLDAFFTPVLNTTLDIGRVINLSVTLPAERGVIALPVQSIYENDRVYKIDQSNRLLGVRVKKVGDHLDIDGNFRLLVRSVDIKAGDTLVTTQLPRAISGLLVDPVDTSLLDSVAVAEVP